MRGRRSFGNAPGGGGHGEKWYKQLPELTKPKRGKPREIRIVGGTFTIFQHFVRFKSKQGSMSGFYELCPDFDWETGEFRQGPDRCCPLCRDFSSSDLPNDLRMYGSYRYYFDAFDITAAKAGNVENAFGVVFVNKYGRNDLAAIADMLGTDVDDEARGHTIFWHYNEDASDPKDRTRFYQGKRLPVKYDEDKDVYVLAGGGKRFVGEPTDFAEIIGPAVKTGDRIQDDLKRLGCYTRLEDALEIEAEEHNHAGVRPTASVKVEDDPDVGDDWGEDEEVEEPPKKKKPAKKKPAKKKPAKKKKPAPEPEEEEADDGWGEEEDDDWGEEPAEEPKPKKKKAANKKKKAAPEPEPEEEEADEGWGEEEDDDWGEEPEEEPEPEKKSKKKAAKKKPAKKKKPAPEPEEEEDDDGWGDDDWGEDDPDDWD
jgi:hypothetical protein